MKLSTVEAMIITAIIGILLSLFLVDRGTTKQERNDRANPKFCLHGFVFIKSAAFEQTQLINENGHGVKCDKE